MKRDRISEIAELLDKRGRMTFDQLEEHFPNVSQMTLRRDLFQLEEEGKVIRVRGGAMSVREVEKTSAGPYTKKTTMNTDEKIIIAQKAAELIDEGASLFIDGGTTALYLVKEMADKPCNVFTNGLAVATELSKKKNVVVNLLGGQLIKENLSTASSFSSRVHPTIIFTFRHPPSLPSILPTPTLSLRSSPRQRLRPKAVSLAVRRWKRNSFA